MRSEARHIWAVILIVGAFVDARSGERFARIAADQDDKLLKFYRSLLKSEVRHYQDYLDLAEHLIGRQVSNSRIQTIAERERELIQTPDNEVRFHCGPLNVYTRVEGDRFLTQLLHIDGVSGCTEDGAQ